MATLRRPADRPFRIGTVVAVTAMLIQVGLGFAVFGQGLRPGSDYHLFYGFMVLFTFTFAYIFRAQLAVSPGLRWGLLALFVAGLGIRAWMTFGRVL